jgi:uncharacterized membrane protein
MPRAARLTVLAGVGAIVVFLSALPAVAFSQPQYSIRGLDAGRNSDARAINRWGSILGQTTLDSGQTRPWLWSRSTGIHFLPTKDGYALDINDRGDVLAQTADQGATLWLAGGGVRHPIGDPQSGCGGTGFNAEFLSEHRTVAGIAIDGCEGFSWLYTWHAGQEADHFDTGEGVGIGDFDTNDNLVGSGGGFIAPHTGQAFIMNAGTGEVTWLPRLAPDLFSGASSISPSGALVVGSATTADSGTQHAVAWSGPNHTTITDLTPGLSQPYYANATNVNDHGDILISVSNTNGTSWFLLWHNGHLYRLTKLIGSLNGWTHLSATDINNNGVISADAYRNGSYRAVVLVP